MTPDQHGYVKCVRCGVWVRAESAHRIEWVAFEDGGTAVGQACKDAEACARMSAGGGIPRGPELDAEVGG